MYKVFVNNIPFFIVNENEKVDFSGLQVILFDNERDFDKIFDQIMISKKGCVIYCNENKSLFFDKFKEQFKYVEAAGGLVQNEKNEYLTIFRNGKWDLPKGKAEKGETIEETALREVEEECGISNLKLGNSIVNTIHTYHMFGKDFIKCTYWYEMKYSGNQKLIPQIEEGIGEVKWMTKEELKSTFLKNTYLSIEDVIKCLI